MNIPHKVALVVDRNYGDLLIKLQKTMHVWICKTPINEASVNKIWKKTNAHSLENGVTTFCISDKDTETDMCLKNIETIDEHHNEYSHNPPWSEIHVFGTKCNQEIKAKFEEFGLGIFQETNDGFIFNRKL